MDLVYACPKLRTDPCVFVETSRRSATVMCRVWRISEAMSDELCVEVPAELAESLTGDGFDEVVSFRGFAADAILTVVPAGLAVAANATTILMSREAIGELVDRIRAWMTRHTKSAAGSEFVVEVSARRGHAQSRLRLTSRCETPGAAPQIDTAALAALLESMFADEPGGHSGALPPGS